MKKQEKVKKRRRKRLFDNYTVIFMEKLDPKKTALIVIDIQNGFCSPKGSFAIKGVNISQIIIMVPKLVKFIETLKKKGILVVYTKQIENYRDSPENVKRLFIRSFKNFNPHATKNNFEGKFYKVKPGKDDIIIEKKTWDAFSNPKLNRILKKEKITHLTIAGIFTNVCVESTARRAFTEGYDVIIPKDLVAVSKHNWLLHKYSLKPMEKYIAQVAHSKEIIKALGG